VDKARNQAVDGDTAARAFVDANADRVGDPHRRRGKGADRHARRAYAVLAWRDRRRSTAFDDPAGKST
jgi:hypothetical protein